jgi:hypothetical protein
MLKHLWLYNYNNSVRKKNENSSLINGKSSLERNKIEAVLEIMCRIRRFAVIGEKKSLMFQRTIKAVTKTKLTLWL